MKKASLILFVLMFSMLNAQIERPKLVVGIVVDQMRPDYLYRYYNDYGNGGFKKLMTQGFVFKNTHYNYMPTYTAPGHSSIYTGTTPAVHGIVGNSWYHKSEGEKVYCTTDMSVKSVGVDAEDKVGRMSPHRLKSTTITDELKLDTNFKGKVVGISIKDRGAILPAGHFADAAYWMDKNGKFVSSTFYMNELPQWVQAYNKQDNAAKYVKNGWNLLKPMAEYNESLPDNNPYERVFPPKKTPTFPYDLAAIAKENGDNSIVKTTPYGNNMVAELAQEAITGEDLGKDDITDFLAVSFSSTDYVGHSFAPRSVEIQDTYLRLDETIAQFLNFLDKNVGKGNYLLFLTADHAAAENPAFLKDRKYAVNSINGKEVPNKVKALIEAKYGEGIFNNFSNQNLFLNENIISERNLNYNQMVKDIQNELMQLPYVSRVFSRAEILAGNSNAEFQSMIARGFDPKQNGDLVVLFDPQYIVGYENGGTTHGSIYSYDTHVPNLWYGWNVPVGKTAKRYEITDLVPTISQMLNIPIPNGSLGNVLEEILE